MIPITFAIAMITSFYVIVGPDKVLFFLNTLRNERGVQLINWGYYENALIAYAVLALISGFFSFGLVACTRITLEERDSKFVDGMIAALRNLHWVFIWAFIAWTIGPILTLLDHQRHTSRWVRKALKTSWSLLSYFVIPIVVVDRTNIFSALRRSVQVMSKAWGDGAVSRLGMGWFFLLLSSPTIVVFLYGHYLEGAFPSWLAFVVLALVYMTIVIYQTANSVLSVALYRYALDGTVVEGYKEKWLKEAFVRPKVYVLVEDEPEEDYVPVKDVPAPEGVEPIEEDTGEALTEPVDDDRVSTAEASTGEVAPASSEEASEESTPETGADEPKDEKS